MSAATVGSLAELVAHGRERRRQGDREGAIAAYRAAADLAGAPPAVFFNLGNALFDAGRWVEAEGSYTRALAGDPALTEAALQLARCAVRMGRADVAHARFDALLRATPGNFSARLEAGHLDRQAGQTAPAEAHYRRAIEAAPERWEAHVALARLLEDAGRADEAARHYHRALPAASRVPGGARRVHWHMAKYRLESGNAPGALEAMRQALLALRVERPGPDADERAEMQVDLAEMLLRLDMKEEALRACERASAASAEATLVRLAETTLRYNLWPEGYEVLRRNVRLHPESASAHWNLAHFCAECWQMREALDALARAEALAPQPGAKAMRAAIAARMGDAETALRLFRELAATEGPSSRMASSAAMSALYSDALDAREVADLHRRLFAPLGEGARARDSFANDRDPDRRLRLGLVTADLHRQHPVNILTQPVLARIDPRAFAVTVYFTGVAYDEQTRQARGRVASWVECAHWSDGQLAQRIEADGIDILVDLSGHTARNRMPLFGRRAAPVQVTFLGYPGSTGVPNMDWIIADPVIAPPDHSPLYSERVMRLPNTVFCYAPDPAAYPFPVFDSAHRLRPLTFGSFNNVPKITPRAIGLWVAILARVPGSRLLLKAPSFKDPGAVHALRERFAEQGVEPGRLEFRGPTGLEEMMAEYADIDIALDPVPYNGGATTLQAMWMGAPVVVRAGGHFVSRMGASFMSAAGLAEWVADSDGEYVEIAARMAADRTALLALKQGMREQLRASAAWDIDRYAGDLAAAFRKIWEIHCSAEPGAVTGA